jgi:hypothetical protein
MLTLRSQHRKSWAGKTELRFCRDEHASCELEMGDAKSWSRQVDIDAALTLSEPMP